MALLFPKFQEFSPLFRIADEIDRASRCQPSRSNSRAFAPRFDVQETEETYQLYGELPGVEQSNVNIEWTDDHTLSISGKTEKRSETTNVQESAPVEETAASPEPHYQKPTVEEDGSEDFTVLSKDDGSVTEKSEETVAPAPASAPTTSSKPRYWIKERSFGSFNRTFKFQTRVEHNNVKASMKNGILNIIVPKAKALEPRKVTIN